MLIILYRVYKAVNHHRIRSRCCGRDLDASIDIDDSQTTPMPPNGERAGVPKTTTNPILVIREGKEGKEEKSVD